MKKTAAFILAASIGIGILPSAATAETVYTKPIVVEGEHYTKVSEATSAFGANDALSGGECLHFKSPADAVLPKRGYMAQYKVQVPEEGLYYMDIISSPISVASLSPYQIRINEGEYFDVDTGNTTKTGDLNDTSVGKDLFYEYRLSPVRLKKGVNTIYFKVSKGRQNDGRIWFMLDRFSLVKAPWDIQKISTDGLFNIYEEKDPVNVSIDFQGPDKDSHTLSYRVTDYFGTEVAKADKTIEPGVESVTIEFPEKLKPSHYTVTAQLDGGAQSEAYFSVVTDYDKREKLEDSPFAMDVAGGMLFPTDQAPGYGRALRLMGYKTARERIRWSTLSPERGVFDISSYDAYNKVYKENDINVLELSYSPPARLLDEGKKLPNDLLESYEFAKEAYTQHSEDVEWEFWNEPDIDYTTESETADRYCAYLKAMAIGAHDSGSESNVSMGGMAYPPGSYMQLMMQNDLMPYIDVYNFHGHRVGTDNKAIPDIPPAITQQIAYIDTYDNWNKEIYVSECGMTQAFEEGKTGFTGEQGKTQGRYLVTSTLTALSKGVDKHFYFVLPYYNERFGGWGVFTQDHTPQAAVSTAAAMTKVLGRAVYAGQIMDVPEGVTAYVFTDGGKSTAAVWSETPTPVSIKADQTQGMQTDIMGNETPVSAKDGAFQFTSSPDVTYLTIEGAFPGLGMDYYEKKFDQHEPLTAAQRVILDQIYPESTAEKAKAKGYILSKKEGAQVSVNVTNFNSKEMKGKIEGQTFGGWKLDSPSKEVTVAPFTTQTVTFQITGGDSVLADVITPVIFTGTFDGEKTTKSVTNILSDEDTVATASMILPAYADPASWRDNFSGGSSLKKTVPEEGVISFEYNMGGGDMWAYPYYNLPKDVNFADTAGLVFDVYFEKPVEGVTFRSFVNENNGSSYFTLNGPVITGGWQQIKMPWTDYTATGQPDDNFHLDSDQIKSIQIGMNTRTEKNVKFSIRNVGVYKQDNGGIYGSVDNMVPGNNQELKAGAQTLSAELTDGAVALMPETLTVTVDRDTVPFEYKDGKVTAQFNLEPGTHTIAVRVQDVSGRVAESKSSVVVK